MEELWDLNPSELFSGYDDFNSFIADLRSRCEAAGVYDIVDEANRQLVQWRGGNG